MNELVSGEHFAWKLFRVNGVYRADGRSNPIDVGRHSLGTKDRAEALSVLWQLDQQMAIKHGLAPPVSAVAEVKDPPSLESGWKTYIEYVSRPRIAGGAKTATPKRYRAVYDKFRTFAVGRGVANWGAVTKQLLIEYSRYLEEGGYAYATQFLELNTIKQAVSHLIDIERLPAANRIKLRMRKPEGTDTYCWTREEVTTIISHCNERSGLEWLGAVATALACTGLRISELAALRWSDIRLGDNVLVLTDESTRLVRQNQRERRQIKNGRSRTFPIHSDLLRVLQTLPRATDGYVFHGPRGGRLKPDTVRNILVDDVLADLKDRFPVPESEIGFIDGRLHSFRHYFCSVCSNEGVPEQIVMRWLGQSSSKMVQHYYHLHDAEAQRQMNRIAFV